MLDTDPRIINVLLGAWVFASSFLWPHTTGACVNQWIVGGAIAGVAFLAMYAPRLRTLNVLLALYLFASTWFVPHVRSVTPLTNAITAVAILIVALLPTGGSLTDERRTPSSSYSRA